MNTNPFESVYLQVRSKENRLYDDKVVKSLPGVSKDSPLYHEWKIRAASAAYFFRYLKDKPDIESGLEVGCGNGWLTAFLARNFSQKKFAGIDINETELHQAQRVHQLSNAAYSICDILHEVPAGAPFQCIFLASTIQYFPSIPELINRLLDFGTQDMEIHILDSPLYYGSQVATARQASILYYKNLGVPAMQQFYHHHTYQSFSPYNPIISHPSVFQNWLRKFKLNNVSPFPRIVIRKQLC